MNDSENLNNNPETLTEWIAWAVKAIGLLFAAIFLLLAFWVHDAIRGESE